MISIAKYNNDGVIVSVATIPKDSLHLQEGNIFIGLVNHKEHYFIDGKLCFYTDYEISQRKLINKDCFWKMPERILVYNKTLESFCSENLLFIKNKRKQAENDCFEYDNKIYQINELRINFAAQEAKRIGSRFIKVWILKDNSTIKLNAYQMIGVKQAQDLYISNLFETYLILKNKITIAKTIEEIDAIVKPYR